jgi:hypothetical protein
MRINASCNNPVEVNGELLQKCFQTSLELPPDDHHNKAKNIQQ